MGKKKLDLLNQVFTEITEEKQEDILKVSKKLLGRVHTTQSDTDAGEPNKSSKHTVKFVITGERVRSFV
ncbi:hypothetical protein FACS1894142_8440 [Spirochaetia bacterium]|nr:hypothetical protein FACS1894142_8440 [Spirochaetia bacterium]